MRILEMSGDATARIIHADPPIPAPNEVLIQTARSAICGSEMKTYRGAGLPGGNGGHEAVGTVVALGAAVKHIAEGQRVGVSAMAGCGACPDCARGRFTWCASSRFYGRMHAEYFVIPGLACLPLPDDLPWKEAALLTGDGLGVPWHTSKKIARADIETILVMGCGPIGLGNILLQAHLGRRVIAVDLFAYRIELARQLGADLALLADEKLVERVMDLTDGEGVDVAIDCAGKRASVANSFLAVRKGGTVVFNGESSDEMLAPSRDFIRRELWAVGCWYYFMGEVPEMIELWRNGLDVARMITHEFALDDAPAAFALFDRGLTGKALLRPQALAEKQPSI